MKLPFVYLVCRMGTNTINEFPAFIPTWISASQQNAVRNDSELMLENLNKMQPTEFTFNPRFDRCVDCPVVDCEQRSKLPSFLEVVKI